MSLNRLQPVLTEYPTSTDLHINAELIGLHFLLFRILKNATQAINTLKLIGKLINPTRQGYAINPRAIDIRYVDGTEC